MTAPVESRCVDAGPALEIAGLVHRVLEPGPATAGQHPAVVMVHGRSGDEDAMWPFANGLPPGAVVVAPRAPHPDPEEGGYTWVQREAQDWPDLARFQLAVEELHRFVAALPALYGVDPARVHLMGFSQGAAMAFALAIGAPGQVKGVASLVGFLPERALEVGPDRPLAQVPVFMAVGTRDERVPLARARATAVSLRAAGADLDYHEYNVGHKVTIAGTHDLAAWWRARIGG